MVRSVFFLFLLFLCSCKVYRQDIMFKLDDEFSEANLTAATQIAEQNYRIRTNDFIRLEVFTNSGERIIDPNFELRQGMANQTQQEANRYAYLLREDGNTKLPMVGDVELVGLTIFQAETKLQQLYANHYKDPYVILKFENKRVVVLGANGGLLIPLVNENTSLIEVIAMSGGIVQGAKSQSVKVIRGDLKNPEVYMVDLSTVSGMKASMLRLEPGDIIYIEPWRRVWLEGLRDVSPVLGLVSSVITLALVIATLNQN